MAVELLNVKIDWFIGLTFSFLLFPLNCSVSVKRGSKSAANKGWGWMDMGPGLFNIIGLRLWNTNLSHRIVVYQLLLNSSEMHQTQMLTCMCIEYTVCVCFTIPIESLNNIMNIPPCWHRCSSKDSWRIIEYISSVLLDILYTMIYLISVFRKVLCSPKLIYACEVLSTHAFGTSKCITRWKKISGSFGISFANEANVSYITWGVHFVIYINVSYCDEEIVHDYETFWLR